MDKEMVEGIFQGMNTEITYRIFGKSAVIAAQKAEEELVRLEKIMSCFIPESEVSQINNHAGLDCVKVSKEIVDVLESAAEVSKISEGCFDITVHPLITLWNYKNAKASPEIEEIHEILSLVDYKQLILDKKRNTVKLLKRGQSIDLGGIGKGYASDLMMNVIKRYNCESAFVNIGGNVLVLGEKPDETRWNIGIRHPRKDSLIGTVCVIDKAVVTSGDYQRFYIDADGKRRHHILDPHTGYPAESGLSSVTIIADNAMMADAISTAIFVAGREKALNVLSNFTQVQMILVDQNMNVLISKGLRQLFQSVAGIEVSFID